MMACRKRKSDAFGNEIFACAQESYGCVIYVQKPLKKKNANKNKKKSFFGGGAKDDGIEGDYKTNPVNRLNIRRGSIDRSHSRNKYDNSFTDSKMSMYQNEELGDFKTNRNRYISSLDKRSLT